MKQIVSLILFFASLLPSLSGAANSVVIQDRPESWNEVLGKIDKNCGAVVLSSHKFLGVEPCWSSDHDDSMYNPPRVLQGVSLQKSGGKTCYSWGNSVLIEVTRYESERGQWTSYKNAKLIKTGDWYEARSHFTLRGEHIDYKERELTYQARLPAKPGKACFNS